MALLLVTIVSVGCAQQEGTKMTPDESRTQLDTVLSSIETAVGGEWENTMSQPLECSVEGIRNGVQWTYGRSAARTGDMSAAQADTEKVAKILADAGYEVAPATFDEELGYDIGSNNGEGSEVAFGASALGMSITAGSSCAEGTADDFSS
ncbi:MAG: hypothetical protein ABWY54_03870 [Glaciihabitans sp.]